jgi:hypothetical protein
MKQITYSMKISLVLNTLSACFSMSLSANLIDLQDCHAQHRNSIISRPVLQSKFSDLQMKWNLFNECRYSCNRLRGGSGVLGIESGRKEMVKRAKSFEVVSGTVFWEDEDKNNTVSFAVEDEVIW